MKYLGRITDPKDLITKEFAEGYITNTEYNASHASKAYSVGEYLILNKIIYEVISPIASNGAITVGTNVVSAGTIATIIRDRVKHASVTLTTSDFATNSDSSIPANYVGSKSVSGLRSGIDYCAQLATAPGSEDVVRVAKFKPYTNMNAGVLYVYCDKIPTGSVTFVGTFEQV